MNSKMSASKRLVCASLSIAFLLSPKAVYAHSTEEAKQVRAMILELNSPDKKVASATALTLASQPYQEVAQALINVTLTELNSPFANTFVIGNSVKALTNMATQQHAAQLQKIVNQIEVLANNAQAKQKASLSYILAEARTAESNAQYRADNSLDSLKNYEPQAEAKKLKTPASSNKPSQQAQSSQAGLEDRLMELMSGQDAAVADAAKTLKFGTQDFLSDEILKHIENNDQYEIIGRDDETNRVIDTLVRAKAKNPVLVGPRGAGKTSIAQKVAMQIATQQLPQSALFQNELQDAYVIETSPARISRLAMSDQDNSQAAALESYFDAILTLEKRAGVKIVLFMDEIHTLGKGQIEAMKPYLDSRDKAIRLIGASTSVEYQNAFKSNPAIQRRFETIGVNEQTVPEVIQIVSKASKPKIEKRANVRLSDEAVRIVVENAVKVYPDTSRVDGAGKMLEDIAINERRKAEGEGRAEQTLNIDEAEVYSFMQKKLGFPVNPLDVKAMQQYRQDLIADLNEKVIGQDRMINDVVGQWMMLMRGQGKGVRTAMILGQTGSGKSLLGRELAKKVFGSEGAFLEVDANQFKEGGFSTNTFFGAPNGVLSSDKTSGMLFDYLDDPGKGKFGGVILINEIERAGSDFHEKLMELMDTGKGTGGDGKERTLGRHLIIMTSNKGDSILFPKTMENWTEQEKKAHDETMTEERLKEIFSESTLGKSETNMSAPLLARINKFTVSEPMNLNLVKLVAAQKAKKIAERAAETYKVRIELDPNIAPEIAAAAYEKGMGARPVEKKVEDLLEMAIDRGLVASNITRGETLKVSLVKNGSRSVIQVQTNSGVATTEIPAVKKQDLLDDQDHLNKLAQLEDEMKTRIIGQDEMIKRIVDATIAHQVDAGKRPLSFMLVGTTGTGKTEVAKALSKTLYGSDNRYKVFDMGKIIYEGEFNDIFGSPTGHVGSTQESPFETFLRENPRGGVIVLDEISNMGGNVQSQKDALFKKLYSIFEEGTWTSPASKKVYDLSQYTIVNTGNDLEKALQGQAADDIRLAIWKKLKGGVRDLLRQAGVPEAFLGRMADVIMMKPLLSTEVKTIAAKMLNEQLDNYRKRGMDIQFDETFLRNISEKFFTQNQGARSIRNMIEHRVKSAITQIVIKAKGTQNLAGKTIVLSVRDNKEERTYIKKSDPARKVEIIADLMNGNKKELSVELDATEFASKINLQNKNEVLRTSYHEAGHAVVNNPKISGNQISLITVVGRDNYLGYARYEEISGATKSSTEQGALEEMATLLAGGAAERMIGLQESEGSSNDTEKARQLASRFVVKSGLGQGMKAVRVDKDNNPILSGKAKLTADAEVERLFAAAEQLAEQRLKANWNLVRAVVSELYYRGEISGQRFEQLQRSVKNTSMPQAWKKQDNQGRITRVRCDMIFN